MRPKVTNLSQIKTEIRKRITKALRDKDVRDGLGEILVAYIRTQTFGTAPKGTKAYREYLEKYNITDPDYNRDKIKAIFTGELLKDLAGNVRARFVGGKATYEFAQSKKKHSKYQGKKKKIGSRTPYSTIQEGLEKLGYNYIKVDDATLNKMVSFVREKVLSKLN